MLIHSSNSVTTTGEILITKAFHQLVFETEKNPRAMDNETIHLYLERSNGKNVDICKPGTRLRDFISLDTFGVNAVLRDGSFYYAKCPISQANFPLKDDEVFKMTISGMDNPSQYNIYAMEVPESSNTLVTMDTTVFSSDRQEQKFTVEGNDMLLLRGDTNVFTEMEYMDIDFINGNSVRYHPVELLCLQTDADWCAQFGTTVNYPRLVAGELVLPLRGINQLTIRKAAGNPMHLVFMDFNTAL